MHQNNWDCWPWTTSKFSIKDKPKSQWFSESSFWNPSFGLRSLAPSISPRLPGTKLAFELGALPVFETRRRFCLVKNRAKRWDSHHESTWILLVMNGKAAAYLCSGSRMALAYISHTFIYIPNPRIFSYVSKTLLILGCWPWVQILGTSPAKWHDFPHVSKKHFHIGFDPTFGCSMSLLSMSDLNSSINLHHFFLENWPSNSFTLPFLQLPTELGTTAQHWLDLPSDFVWPLEVLHPAPFVVDDRVEAKPRREKPGKLHGAKSWPYILMACKCCFLAHSKGT